MKILVGGAYPSNITKNERKPEVNTSSLGVIVYI